MDWDEVLGHGCQTDEPMDLAIMVGDKRASENGMAYQKAKDAIKCKGESGLLWMGRWNAISKGERNASGLAHSAPRLLSTP